MAEYTKYYCLTNFYKFFIIIALTPSKSSNTFLTYCYRYKQILVVDSNSRASAKELSADNIKNAIEAVKNNESLDEKDNQN